MKKSFYKRMIWAASAAFIMAFALSSFYYISRVGRELEKRAMTELEFSSVQMKNTVNAKLQSIINISNWMITNSELNEKLNADYSEPYEYWQFYEYLSGTVNSLAALEDSIRLITVFSPNETLKEDKKNVRSIHVMELSPVWEELMERTNSALFVRMKDAVDDSYFFCNMISNPDNICMLREFSYEGKRSILMIEIKAQLFINEFCREQGKGMYVEDGAGRAVMYYEDGKNLRTEGLSYGIAKELRTDYIFWTETLDNQWKVRLIIDRKVVLADVFRSIGNMTFTSLLIILIFILTVMRVMKSASVKLLRLNEVIEKAYRIGRIEEQEQSEPKDEVEMVVVSVENLIQRVENLMNEVYRNELQNKNMELALLHSQIKPHFLYNTLSSIASLARKYQDEKLMNMIMSLSDLYRISLSRGSDIITVEKEIEMTKSYLVIMENRFEDMIHVEFKIQENVDRGLVPKILLQPFVENSINHALRPDRILNIVIDIRRLGECLVFQIYDDGLGMEEERINSLLNGGQEDAGDEHGYGIPNVHRRIRMYMGEEYGVEIMSRRDIGTNVKITMPYWENIQLFHSAKHLASADL